MQLGDRASFEACNVATANACGDILIQINGDFEPPMNWDMIIESAFAGTLTSTTAVLWVGDGQDPVWEGHDSMRAI